MAPTHARPNASIAVFEPPDELHKGCPLCDIHFYSLESQEADDEVRYTGAISDEEAQDFISLALDETRNHLGSISERLKSHGDLLISRWSKKSKDKRGRLLSGTAWHIFGEWPCATQTQRDQKLNPPQSVYAAHSMLKTWEIESYADLHRSPWAPWMRIADIVEDRMKLLSLFHVRTAYSQQDWAMFDTSETDLEFRAPGFPIPYNPKFVRMVGDDFGGLVDVDIDLVHSRTILGFPRALVTFKAQQEITNVLHKVIDAIVGEAAPSGNSKWKALVFDDSSDKWDPYKDSGFMQPSVGLDTAAMLQMCRGKLHQIVDEVELMQTDPEYMREYVLGLKASIRWDEGITSAVKWNYVSDVVHETWAFALGLWYSMAVECEELYSACQQEYQGDTIIAPGTRLSPNLIRRFCSLETLISQHLSTWIKTLERSIRDMSAMKHMYRKCVRGGALYNVKKVKDRGAPTQPSNRISITFDFLKAGFTSWLRFYGPRMDSAMLTEQLTTAKYDKRVDDQLSGLALLDALRLSTIWSQVVLPDTFVQLQSCDGLSRHYRPKDRSLDASDLPPNGGCEATPSLQAKPVMLPEAHCFDDPSSQNFGLLLRGVCDNPWPKAKSGRAWLEDVARSRAHLTKYWLASHDSFLDGYRTQGYSYNIAAPFIASSMSFCVSSAHLAEVQKECQRCEAEIAQSENARELEQSCKLDESQVLQSIWGVENETKLPVRKKHTKAKLARALIAEAPKIPPLGDAEPAVEHVRENADDAPQQCIAVKQDSLTVFHRMFLPNRGTAAMRWTQLSQALTDAGLAMTQLPGSGVRFSNESGSVTIDKPHPDPVVSPVMLRRHVGRRLEKRFGWGLETFVLRGKVEKDEVVDSEKGRDDE